MISKMLSSQPGLNKARCSYLRINLTRPCGGFFCCLALMLKSYMVATRHDNNKTAYK